jgi:hypothetical protein
LAIKAIALSETAAIFAAARQNRVAERFQEKVATFPVRKRGKKDA